MSEDNVTRNARRCGACGEFKGYAAFRSGAAHCKQCENRAAHGAAPIQVGLNPLRPKPASRDGRAATLAEAERLRPAAARLHDVARVAKIETAPGAVSELVLCVDVLPAQILGAIAVAWGEMHPAGVALVRDGSLVLTVPDGGRDV